MAKSRPSSDDSHFLLLAKEDPLSLEHLERPRLQPLNRLRSRYFWLYVYLVLLHFVVLVFYLKYPSSERPEQLTGSFSPAFSAIHHEVHKLHDLDDNAFSGPPSSENLAAWNSLLEPTYFNLSREEMVAANESFEGSVEFVNGGYQTALSVYHELHCLLRFRVFLYKETYYPNITETQMIYVTKHLDHCIDTLRRSSMCRADTSLYTFRWRGGDVTRKPELKTNAERVCVNWQAVETWGQERKADGLRKYPVHSPEN